MSEEQPSLESLRAVQRELQKRQQAAHLRLQVARGDGSTQQEVQKKLADLQAVQADLARVDLAIHELQSDGPSDNPPAVQDLLDSLEKSAKDRSAAAIDRTQAASEREEAATRETRAVEAEHRTHAIASDLMDNVVTAWLESGTKASRLAAGVATLVFAGMAALLAKSDPGTIPSSVLALVFTSLSLALLAAVLPVVFHLMLASNLSGTDMHQVHDEMEAVRSAEASIRRNQMDLHRLRLWLTILQFVLGAAALVLAGFTIHEFYVVPPSGGAEAPA